jgi:hypothetical protein
LKFQTLTVSWEQLKEKPQGDGGEKREEENWKLYSPTLANDVSGIERNHAVIHVL